MPVPRVELVDETGLFAVDLVTHCRSAMALDDELQYALLIGR
jgi:hypothetical protein